MLVALSSIASAPHTEAAVTAITQLLNYAATHPSAVVRYHASAMTLHVHSDASYLSEPEAKSRSGGFFYLSSTPAPTDTTSPDCRTTPAAVSPLPPLNGAIHTPATIIRVVVASAAEAEMGALFFNAKDATWLRTTLQEMGHPQPATPLTTDNSCAAGILNNTVKQRRSKAIDMRFYWVRDRVAQGHFTVLWRRGADNLADYFTKHHSPAHHRLMRSRYLLDFHRPPRTIPNKGVLKPASTSDVTGSISHPPAEPAAAMTHSVTGSVPSGCDLGPLGTIGNRASAGRPNDQRDFLGDRIPLTESSNSNIAHNMIKH
jgi:hypothetical protein